MTQNLNNEMDQELEQFLEVASQLSPNVDIPMSIIQNHAPTWPWQVPQSPVYTSSDSTPLMPKSWAKLIDTGGQG